MATSNLSSKSLGDILLQSGNGTPNHSSPKGSLYTDQDTATLYINTSGTTTTWQNFVPISYGEGYYVSNGVATTISASNTWYAVNNTFTTGATNGFSVSANTLVVGSGRDGLYNVQGSVTIAWVAGTPNYEVGISINGGTPPSVSGGTYNGATISTTYTTANIAFDRQFTLNGGDTIQLAVRNLTDTSNVIIRHAQLVAHRVK